MPRAKNNKRGVSPASDLETAIGRELPDLAVSRALLDRIAEAVSNRLEKTVLAELKKSIEFCTETILDLKKEISDKDKTISNLRNELQNKVDDLEQYQRRGSLRIFGIKEKQNEDTDTIVMETASKLGVKVNSQDIDRSHRVGPKTSEKPRPIIVKFVSYKVRSELFRQKRKLKGSGITIREDLTIKRTNLLNAAITKFGLKNVWTSDGKIIVRSRERKVVVLDFEQLSELERAERN